MTHVVNAFACFLLTVGIHVHAIKFSIVNFALLIIGCHVAGLVDALSVQQKA